MTKPNNLRLLVTGGSSYLGQALVPTAVSHFATTYTYFRNDPLQQANGTQVDLRDETAVRQLITEIQPHVIIHTAGSNRGDDMAAVIRLGARHITQAAKQVGARLIHISTDSIFAGDAAPYDETAVPTPINEYGRAKADAEAIVSEYAAAVIVRPSLIYNLEMMDRGTSWMVAALKAGEPVTLFSNQLRNPVWTGTLVNACLELAVHSFRGIINIAGTQVLSRAEFGVKMLDYWAVPERDTLTIAPYTGNEWPLNCELDLNLATAVLKTPLISVDELLHSPKSENH